VLSTHLVSGLYLFLFFLSFALSGRTARRDSSGCRVIGNNTEVAGDGSSWVWNCQIVRAKGYIVWSIFCKHYEKDSELVDYTRGYVFYMSIKLNCKTVLQYILPILVLEIYTISLIY
jgi:hypothetical protein